jgi:hydroxymethyl cephem carbamoyltransferase
VETPEFARVASYLSRRLFDAFHGVAETSVPRDRPLLIGGGCGLNCDWNRRWLESGFFSDVFIPPCTDDSGVAIGAAVEAQILLGGECRLDWSVYAGPDFADTGPPAGWQPRELAAGPLSAEIHRGAVVAWVEGRCEIGPRALGHRSLLADAGDAASVTKLNAIKRRESYRPIAPVCTAGSASRYFAGPRLDPFMLFLADVRDARALPSITHVDGTARLQALPAGTVPRLESLLDAFASVAGYGVLCNTSLNWPGRGFINRSDDLFAFCEANGIDHAVVDGTWFARNRGATPPRRPGTS